MSPLPWESPLQHALLLTLAVVLDLWRGEPPVRIHPVVWMGRLIHAARDAAPSAPWARLLWGLAMAILLPTLCAAAAAALIAVPWIGPVLGLWLLTSSISIRLLGEAGLRVGEAVSAGRIDDARAGLSWLCSRDPQALSGEELAGAAAESIAENASDSLVAPLLWLLIGGIPGAVFYRCVNTMDAMIGYRDRYFWLGKPAARLDDILNLIPARVTALMMLLVADRDRGRGLRCMLRDAGKTDSPNAGWPMAAMAGLLGVEMTKRGQYALGEPLHPISGADVRRCWRIARRSMLASALLTVALQLGQHHLLNPDVAVFTAVGLVVEEAQDHRP